MKVAQQLHEEQLVTAAKIAQAESKDTIIRELRQLVEATERLVRLERKHAGLLNLEIKQLEAEGRNNLRGLFGQSMVIQPFSTVLIAGAAVESVT